MFQQRIARATAAFVALTLATACGSDNSTSSTATQGPASLQLTLTSITLDAIGATRNDTAVARDANGTMLPNAPVVWSTSSSAVTLAMPTAVGGLLRAASVVAPVSGQAVVIVAETPGTAVITATSGTISRQVSVTIAPVAARVIIVSGDQQSGTINTPLGSPLRVKVLDRLGNPIAGQAVTFTTASGGGSVSPATATSGSDGTATATWTLGSAAGTQRVTASAGSAISAQFTATTTSTGVSGFTIQVQFLSSMTVSQQAAFTSAAARWSTLVVGDLEDVPLTLAAGQCGDNSPALNTTIDDLLIFATIDSIDGPGKVLGSAGPCFVRSTDGLTIVGAMTFDEADVAMLEAQGAFTSVVLHEMGHVLGIGTFWPQKGLQNQTMTGAAPQDTYFPGPNAIIGFNAIGGNAYSGGKVPVENTGATGTINAHWRESVLGNELMTGYLNASGPNPLSVLTVRSLQDLGYTVNASGADAFSFVASLRGGANIGPQIQLQGDVRSGSIYSVDKTGAIKRIK